MRVGRAVVLFGAVAFACAGRSQGSDDSGDGESGSSSGATSGTGGSSGGASGGASSGGSSSATGGVSGDGGSSGSQAPTGGSSGSTTGGFAGTGGAMGGSGGSTGGSSGTGQGEPRPCNSSDGSGCNDGEICLDITTDPCAPNLTEDCSGYCAPTLPPSDCDGTAQCVGTVTCPAMIVEACPAGLARSFVDECWGPCVPVDCCGCSTDVDCQLKDASCDVSRGRCVVPAAPEPRCLLPFDPGPCDGAGRVFAFVDGHCQERVWGLCEGNDNRFFTLEECLRRCEGVPQQGECPEGRAARQTCLSCGPGGGCAEFATVCAKSCDAIDDCDSGLSCLESFCGVNFCI